MISLMRTLIGLVIGGLIARIVALLGRFHAGTAVRPTVTRRSFLRNATLGAVLIVLAELAAGFVRFIWPNKQGTFGSALNVAASDVPEKYGKPYQFAPGKFYLVRNDDGLLALYWKCPHLGCTVPYVGPAKENDHLNPRAFQCPCHGSMYDYNGVLTGGPAPRPMDLMKVTVNPDGSVTVDTGKITERHDYEPSQAVPYPA